MNQVLGGQHSLHGAQRLGASGGDGAAGGHVHGLEGVFHLDLALDHIAYQFTEAVLKIMLDDKNHLGKAGVDRIVDGIEHQHLVVGAHAVNLLVAAVAGTHTSCHNQ